MRLELATSIAKSTILKEKIDDRNWKLKISMLNQFTKWEFHETELFMKHLKHNHKPYKCNEGTQRLGKLLPASELDKLT